MNSNLYLRLFLWLSDRRKTILILTGLGMILCIGISTRLRLEEDILDTLPRNDRLIDEYRYSIRKFRQIDRVYIDVGVDKDDSVALARAAEEVSAALATNTAFIKILDRFESGGQAKVIDYLTGALPNLFTEADAVVLEKKLDPVEVRDFLTVMRNKLSGPEGMALKDVVANDPIASSALVLKKLMPLQAGFGDAQIVDGRITSSDGRHVLLLAEPRFPSSDSGHSTELVADILNLAREVEAHVPGAHVAITGGHRMSVDNATLIKGDATRCIFLGMGAMLVLCLAAFRRRWLSLLAFLPSFFGTLIAGVVLALWQHHLSAIATGFATIAIGITVDYAIYVIYHLDNAAGLDREAVGRHVGHLVLPIGVGALTTMLAFLVMATSPIHGYQQLGIFGAIGVLFSAIFALVILPLMVPVPKERGQPPLWLTTLMERFHAYQARWQPLLWIAIILLTVFGATGLRKLRFEGDIAKLNGITESTRRDEESIRKTWGDALGMTLVVARGKTVDEALAQNDRAAKILSTQKTVSAVYSLSAICPSRATQEENMQRWRVFWTASRRDALRETLRKVGADLGFRPEAFEPFWKRLNSEAAFLTLETFRGTPLEEVLNERVAVGETDSAVSTLIKMDDRSQTPQLREELSELIVLDREDLTRHIADLARLGMNRFAWLTGILVACTVYFSLASVELMFATLLPLAFGLLWTFGTMGWLGLPIDLMNSMFVIFIIGIGEDYSLFFVTSKLDEWRGAPPRLAATSASVLISALTTIFGFAVLVFARHPVLFSLGTTVLIGMGFTFAATLALTPLCMDLILFKPPPRGAPRWWHPLGTVWALVHLGGSQIFLYYILRPFLKITSPRDADDRLRRATRYAARGVVKAMPFGKVEFRRITPETFSPQCIVISNHQSAVDVLLMVSLPGDVRQTAKKRVFDAPMLGIGCKLLGHIMVEPNDPETTLRRCRERLDEGACVHFYPEGSRSLDGFVGRFHRGAFELAVELKKDILPILLCDTNTAMPRDAYWFEPYRVIVAALPRVSPANFDYSLGSVALMRHCETIVRDALQKKLDELNTPKIVRRKVARLYRHQGKFVEQFVYWKMRLDPVFETIDQIVPRHGRILDLGCGYGVVTQWLARFTDTRTFLGVDYDENKIRVAQRTAPADARIQFEARDILDWEYPAAEAILLMDVLHYWTPEKQQRILSAARKALHPGGRLILRDAARAATKEHKRVDLWERFATRIGHNKTREGLHFQTLAELEEMLRRAGFAGCEIKRAAGRDSNVLLIATVEPKQCSDARTPGIPLAAS